MVYIILILLAAVLAEAAVLGGKEIWDMCRHGGGTETPEGGAPESAETENERKWQEGISAMMGYDLGAARKAARRDEDE